MNGQTKMTDEHSVDRWLTELLQQFAQEPPTGEERQRQADFLQRCQAAASAAFAIRGDSHGGQNLPVDAATRMERLIDFVRDAAKEQAQLLESCGIVQHDPVTSATAWGRLCRWLRIPRESALAGFRRLVVASRSTPANELATEETTTDELGLLRARAPSGTGRSREDDRWNPLNHRGEAFHSAEIEVLERAVHEFEKSLAE